MTYNPKSNQRNNFPKKTFVLSIFLILLLFFFGKSLSGFSLRIFAPAMSLYRSFSTSLSSGFNLLTPKQTLIRENENLKERVAELEAENLKNQAILSEQEIFSTATSTDASLVKALILVFPPQIPFDTLIIDKGAKDYLLVGAKIFLADRVEIGLVEEVFANQSRVRLFSSSGIKTEAILERTGEVVELLGAGSGGFRLEVPASFDIQEGDIFVLPGSPRIMIAKTISIKKDETSSFVSIFLSSPIKVNGNSLLYVQI